MEAETLILLAFLFAVALRTAYRLWQSRIAARYAPYPRVDGSPLTTSVIATAYNEPREAFIETIRTWATNSPDEIIVVLDPRNAGERDALEDGLRTIPDIRVIVAGERGKRPALNEGFKASTGDVVVFVDSDTSWPAGTLRELVAPFANDEKIGAVSPAIETDPSFLAGALFEMMLRKTYDETFPCAAVLEGQVPYISGQTAAYRRTAVESVVPLLLSEVYKGKHPTTGDDIFLSVSVRRNGWTTAYQRTALVRTAGPGGVRVFARQMLRWQRNSIRNLGNGLPHSSNILRAETAMKALPLAVIFVIAGMALTGNALEGFGILAAFVLGDLACDARRIAKLPKRHWAALAVLPSMLASLIGGYAALTPRNFSWYSR